MNKPVITLANGGVMGEPEVLRALLGPQINVRWETLPGLAVYRQTDPPDQFWQTIKQFWDDKGTPYLAAYTVVPTEGRSALVGCVDFESMRDLKKAADRLNYWSFHDPDPEKAWFRYEAFRLGNARYLTERLNIGPAELVKDGFRETGEYKKFVRDMVNQATEYRLSLERAT